MKNKMSHMLAILVLAAIVFENNIIVRAAETSLFYNTAPIIHARTAYLPYYNGHASGHYIAISEVDKANATIRLKDCNNNSAYYGQHIVSVNDAYKAINEESSRYLICMQY